MVHSRPRSAAGRNAGAGMVTDPTAAPTPEEIVADDWLNQKMADPGFREGFLMELAKVNEGKIRAAVAAETARCAVVCINRWAEETDHSRRNALSHGCIASAAAIRAEVKHD